MVSAQILQVRVEYRYLIWYQYRGIPSESLLPQQAPKLHDFPPMLNSSVVPKTSIGIEVVSKCIKFRF